MIIVEVVVVVVVVIVVVVVVIVVVVVDLSRSDLHLCVPTAMRIVEHIGKSWDSLHESPEECGVHCVAL